MSPRANILIKDSDQTLLFYRHWDGYPSGVAKTLTHFLNLVKTGKIRNNVGQAAGWLIMIGAAENDRCHDIASDAYDLPLHTPIDQFVSNPADWKVGAYEPTTAIHSDISYLYEIDLTAQTLRGWGYVDGAKGEEITHQIKE